MINQTTETGIPGVDVKVFDTAGDPFGSTITGPNGDYSFTGLSSGNYLIQEATPTGFYQTNPSFPNVLPTPQSTPGSYGNNSGNWNYTGGDGTVGPPNWVINGTPAPFESALNLTGPTVNLGNILGLGGLTNFTTTNLVNKEYQLQVVPQNVAESITVNGTPFNLANIHFHDPTENTVNGSTPGGAMMEEHIVTQAPTVNGVGGGETVLATFIQVGSVANPTFDKLFGALTNLGTSTGSTLQVTGTFSFADLLPTNHQGWFYPGSLTTPPLSTPVNWFVFANPIEIDTQEYNEYVAYANSVGFLNNNRPTQDPAGRVYNSLLSESLGTTSLTDVNFIVAAVPEPASLIMMGLGTLAVLGQCWRARRRAAV